MRSWQEVLKKQSVGGECTGFRDLHSICGWVVRCLEIFMIMLPLSHVHRTLPSSLWGCITEMLLLAERDLFSFIPITNDHNSVV